MIAESPQEKRSGATSVNLQPIVINHVENKTCRKQNHDKANKVGDGEDHTFVFQLSDDKLSFEFNNEHLLVDCGATTHVVNKDAYFIDEDPKFNPAEHFIQLADGSRSNNVALKKGTVIVHMRAQSGKMVKVKLENTLYIPTYPQNIFSVQAATQKGATIKFHHDCRI